MGRFSPVRSQCQFDTPGERRFTERAPALPKLSRCGSDWQEWDSLVTRIRTEQVNGRVPGDMTILYRIESQARTAKHALTQAGILCAFKKPRRPVRRRQRRVRLLYVVMTRPIDRLVAYQDYSDCTRKGARGRRREGLGRQKGCV